VTDPVRVLYIAGLPHSGSTVVARVLGEVDGLFAAGEITGLSDRTANGDRCGCGAVLAECPFWGAVLGSLPDAGALARLRPDRRWIHGRTLVPLALGRDRERLRAYRDDLAKLYRAIAAVSGCRVIVDTSKSPTFAWVVGGAPGVELYGVHLVRDPRATSYSWSVDPHYHRTRGVAFGARWTLWNLELEALSARRRSRFVRLRLEDFVRDPVAETRRILRLVGADHADLPFVDARSARLPAHHMIEGHASRFETGVVPIRPSTTWRAELSTRRELSTSLFASPLQLLYGYPVARRPALH
jgi:hypothetical protein